MRTGKVKILLAFQECKQFDVLILQRHELYVTAKFEYTIYEYPAVSLRI